MTRQYDAYDDVPKPGSTPSTAPTGMPSEHPLNTASPAESARPRFIPVPKLDKSEPVEPSAAFESAMEMGKPKELPTLYPEILGRIFNFSPAMLSANRGGSLAQQQSTHLLEDLKQESDSMWLLMQIFVGMSFFIAVILLMEGVGVGALALTAGGLMGALLLYGYRRQTRRRVDAAANVVKSVQGQAMLDVRATLVDVEGRWNLFIGQERFRITPEQVKDLAQYRLPILRVYYVEQTRRIVSAEIIGYQADEDAQTPLTHQLAGSDYSEEDAPEVIYVEKNKRSS